MSTSAASVPVPVPVVLVGARGHGRWHLANIRRLQDQGLVRLVGICEPNPLTDDELEAFADAELPPQSDDFGALLDTTGARAAVICTPIQTHTELALTAAARGVHLLLEKPPAATFADYMRMTDGVRAAGVACQIGFQSFGSHAVPVVQELVRTGAIGPVRGIGAAGAWVRDDAYHQRAPWAGRRRLGTVDVVDGVLTNPLAHAVATALELVGRGAADDVASIETELFRANDIEADDTSCVRITTTDGLPVTVAVTLCAERAGEPYVIVHGSHGRITFWYKQDRLLLQRAGHGPEDTMHGRTDLLENLVDHLVRGTGLLAPAHRTGAFMRVVEAVRNAPEPTALPAAAWHTEPATASTGARRVVRGIDGMVAAGADTLTLFSELGVSWALPSEVSTVTTGDSMTRPPWTADLGDGTYRNPVLNADWSDPDVVRVGDDYYLTASSFGRAPGLPLLHSRDLVNWTLVGHALGRLEPAADFAVPRHDCGVWAPSLRHHGGRFWIFWGDPDHGIQQINAEDIRGPWTAPHLVKAGKGLIDACPLWDEDTGEAYLVHAWAKSRSGVKNRLTGHRMSPDGRELLDDGKTLVDADRIPGWFTLEGPKLYRHEGYFWIFAPAGGVETGWQGAFRSREFFGPYEERVVLAQGDTQVNGPHQGGWVRTAAGEDWFLHFQARGAYGRVVHLQPMRWATDTEAGVWPVIGDNGEPVSVHPKPAAPPQPVEAPASDDDFPGGRYGRQWQWTANPRPGWTVEHAGDGLRLSCVRTAYAHDLRALPNVLVQRLPAEAFTVEVDVSLNSDEPGAKAGLAVLGDAFSWIGLEAGADGTAQLVHRYAETVAEHERDAAHPRPAPGARARLRIEVTPGARCRFFTDTGDGAGFRSSGQVFAAAPWRWVGALLGLFATAPAGTGPSGTAGFTAFRTSD